MRRVLKTWEFVSPLDSWTLLHGFLTSSPVDAFESVIIDVLGENNPALDLPPEKRFLAAAQGKRFKFSDMLRRGLTEVLALSAGLASEGLVADDHNFIGRARSIVCRLLPTGSDWKRWASIGDLLPLLAEGWTGRVADTDYWHYISGIANLALYLATADGTRWPELLHHCTALSPVDRSRMFAALEQINPATLNDEQCAALWNALRKMVQKHTAFHDAGWALPVEEVKRLATIRDRFAPQDVVEIAVPLFSDGQLIYERIDLPFKERAASLSQRRQSAIERIWNTNGLSGVLGLATKVKESWRLHAFQLRAPGSALAGSVRLCHRFGCC